MTPLEKWKKMAKIENARMRSVAAPYGSARSVATAARQNSVKDLYMQGYRCFQIAQMLNEPRTSVSHDLKVMREDGRIPEVQPQRMADA